MQIAIADSNNRINLWCNDIRETKEGKIHFSVINGAWDGWVKDDKVYVKETKKTFFGKIVWKGMAPFSTWKYNEAIAWIQESVDKSGGRLRDYIYIPQKSKLPKEWEDDDIPF